MTAFEVFVNGEKACTAGVGDIGRLHSSITLILRKRKRDTKQTGEGDAVLIESFHFGVGASIDLPDDTTQLIGWLDQSVVVGDEITIRIIETEVVDKPSEERIFRINVNE